MGVSASVFTIQKQYGRRTVDSNMSLKTLQAEVGSVVTELWFRVYKNCLVSTIRSEFGETPLTGRLEGSLPSLSFIYQHCSDTKLVENLLNIQIFFSPKLLYPVKSKQWWFSFLQLVFLSFIVNRFSCNITANSQYSSLDLKKSEML